MPAEVQPVVQYFDENYDNGRIRANLPDGTINRSAPLYPPEVWSVENVHLGFPRT